MSQPEVVIAPAVLNTFQTAAYINRDPRFIRAVLKHEVPYHQHGARGPMFFEKRDLDVWLEKNKRRPVQ